MANFLNDIENALNGETPEAIAIGGYGGYCSDDSDPVPETKTNKPLPWNEEVKGWLNYEYSAGYGGEECHPIYIWTKTRLLLVSCYDGSTGVESIPRNPTEEEPMFIGGG
jgi:hypothetical protein